MNDKKVIVTLAALLALSAGGNLYNAAGEQIEVEQSPAGQAVDVTGLVKTVLDQKIADSAAGPQVHCVRGYLSNKPPETVYCFDGGKAGFILDKTSGDAVVGDAGSTILYKMGDGSIKAVTLETVAAAEAEAKAK